MVLGLDELVGKVFEKSCFLSLPLNSSIFSVNGNIALNAFAVALSNSVALTVFEPTLIFILLPFVLSVAAFIISIRITGNCRVVFITTVRSAEKRCY